MRDGWRRVALIEVADVTMGRQRSPKHATGPSMVPYMRAANVKDGVIRVDDVLEMNFNADEQKTYRLISGDVLVTEGCGSIRELGASARWTGQMDGTVCFQNHLLRLRAIPGVALPEFIEQWARWAHTSGIWAGQATGTNILNIGLLRARQIPVLVPPISEQGRIVDVMTAIDDAFQASIAESAAARATADTLIDEGLRSTSTTALLDELTLGIEAGKSPPAENRRPAPGELAVLKVSAVRPGYFDPSEVKVIASADGFPDHAVLRTGDLLITRANTRALVGSVCKVTAAPPDHFLCDKTLRLVPDDRVASSDYLLLALQSRDARRQIEDAATGTSASMKNISQSSIRSIRLPLLPRSSQDQWASAVLAALAQQRAATQCGARLSRLRASLLDDLLSGAHEIPASYDELLDRAS
jgi:type I restriction enzyme S subunit